MAINLNIKQVDTNAGICCNKHVGAKIKEGGKNESRQNAFNK